MKSLDITVAITVFDRREFICQAIESALNQTSPVNVIVVEDCGPDDTLQAWVKSKFGDAVTYYRNSRRRGLFDNWNACVEFCPTPWLSILHDDDYLLPHFAETMVDICEKMPGRVLYFGGFRAVSPEGAILPYDRPRPENDVEEIDLPWLAWNNHLGFGGHIFSTAALREVGPFQAGSWFAGDWNMWWRLAAFGGAVHTAREVVCARVYRDHRKGSARVVRSGRDLAGTIVQRKRNFAYLRSRGRTLDVSVRQMREHSRPSLRTILQHAETFAPRMIAYNLGLARLVRPRSMRHLLMWAASYLLAPVSVRWISHLWNAERWLRGRSSLDQSVRGRNSEVASVGRLN